MNDNIVTSLAEDHEIAQRYADNLKTKNNIRATRDEIYLGARGELALARFYGPVCLETTKEHLLRTNATLNDLRFDITIDSICIDVKTAKFEPNRNLLLNKVNQNVWYVLLIATCPVTYTDAPRDIKLEILGCSPGDKNRFSPFRDKFTQRDKFIQNVKDLLPFNELQLLLSKKRISL
jgi:hypothetical protein